MPAPPPSVQAGSSLTVKWRQYVGKGLSIDDMSLSNEDSRISMTIDIYWADLELAVRQIVGYSKAAGTALQRVLPMSHPIFPWFKAKRIARVQGVKFAGKNVGERDNFGPYAQYLYARLTIEFWIPPYHIKHEPPEYERFITRIPRHVVQSVNFDHGQIIWDTDANERPNGVTEDTPIPHGTEGRTIHRTHFDVVWYQLPDSGLFSRGGSHRGQPVNLASRLGKLNDAEFWNCPRGTLLFQSVEFRPIMFCVRPTEVNGVDAKAFQPPLGWNAHLAMTYFEPERGNANSSERGWNLLPYTDGKWYRAVTKIDHNPLYQHTSFPKLFDMNV